MLTVRPRPPEGKPDQDALLKVDYTSLITLKQVNELLGNCSGLDDLKRIHDEAEAARAYAKAKNLCVELQSTLWIVKQLAEQEMSKLLSAAERSKGGRPENSSELGRVSNTANN
jgi:hypothetical protein